MEEVLTDFRRLDLLAREGSPIHRLDARAKVITTMVFITTVMSFDRYQISALVPFFVFPLCLTVMGNIPLAYLMKRVALVLPFALMVGLFNPLLDDRILIRVGTLGISGGWLSCASILLRAMLTAGAALILVGVTGFTPLCHALRRLGVPQPFVVQLLFLHRYLYVLIEEARQLSRARRLRSFGRRGLGIRNSGPILGNLLLRTWERAERIHLAMLARGFRGEFPLPGHSSFGIGEFAFVTGWSILFITLRFWNLSAVLGRLLTGAGT